MIDINKILETVPAEKARHAEQENESYLKIKSLEFEYKRSRAKLFLEHRATSSASIKEIEYVLDTDEKLNSIQDQILMAEIDYKKHRLNKERCNDEFQGAMELSRNNRQEWYATHDTVQR